MTTTRVTPNRPRNEYSLCWCCKGLLGQCECQNEDMETCMGCCKCVMHCECNQLNTEGNIPVLQEEEKTRGVVEGVGPDAPTITNPDGGRQAYVPYRVDALPPKAVLAISKVVAHGLEKYGLDNWRHIPQRDHLNHALTHVFAHLAADRTDDHLTHAACRLLFALETE